MVVSVIQTSAQVTGSGTAGTVPDYDRAALVRDYSVFTFLVEQFWERAARASK